jgi:uncharacterized protein (TIGR00369 family)
MAQPLTPELLRQITEELNPFQKLLQMRITELEKGRAVMVVPYQEFLLGDIWRPALHGGVLSALLDSATGLAALSTVETVDERLSTLDLHIDYLAPGRAEDLYCTAQVIRRGRSSILVQGRVHHVGPQSDVAMGRAVFHLKRPQAT